MSTLSQIMLQQAVKNTMYAIDSITHNSVIVNKNKEVTNKIQAASQPRQT